MLYRKRMAQHAVAHAAPGRVAHLAVLQMEACVREAVEIAGVVVMQMGDDDVADSDGLDTEALKRIHRIERQLAGARLGFFRVEAGVDQDVAPAAPDQPDEIIQILRRGVMRIGGQEVHVGRARRHGGVAQGVDFVDVSHGHCFFDCLMRAGRRTKPL